MIDDQKIKEFLSWIEVMFECQARNDTLAENYCIDILDQCWCDMSLSERGVANLKSLNLYDAKSK